MTTQFQNKVHAHVRALFQRRGPTWLRRRQWDREFTTGKWDYLDITPGDPVYAFVEKYTRGGGILDLGCGAGNTGNELASGVYQNYTGVDVSDAAIRRARRRSEDSGRANKNVYVRADIVSYAPTQQFDVILFRDSIYYLPTPSIKPVLHRYSRYLKEGGVFIAKIWSAEDKNRVSWEVTKGSAEIVEKYLFGKPATAIVVFKLRLADPSRTT